jgi:CHAT domain-containing protein
MSLRVGQALDPTMISLYPLIVNNNFSVTPGSVSHLDGRIITLQHWLSSKPYSHQERLSYLLDLISARQDRYNLSKQDEDLDKIVLHLTEAILLPRHPLVIWPKRVPQCLFLLARTLLLRFQHMGGPEDLRYSIKYLRHLQNLALPFETLGVPHYGYVMNLVEALGARIGLEAGSAAQNLGEMVVLCRGFLTSDISEDHLADSIVVLSNAVGSSSYIKLGKPLDQVVEFMREAVEILPPGSRWRASIALAQTLNTRFVQNQSIEDFREAIALLDDIIAHNALDGGRRNSDWLDALRLAAGFADFRFCMYPNSENLEDAISRVRTSLAHFSLGDKHYSSFAKDLARLMGKRAEYFHLIGVPQRATFHTRSLPLTGTTEEGFVGSDKTRDVREACFTETIEHLEGLLSDTLPGTLDHVQYLGKLADLYDAKFGQSGDISDLEKCIELRQIELSLTLGDDITMELRLLNLSFDLLCAFRCNHRTSLLDESISLLLHLLKMPGTQGNALQLALDVLWKCHLERWKFLHHSKDLDEVVHFLRMYIDKSTIPPNKLKHSYIWATLSRKTGHPSISTAYETAMTCMQDSLIFSPTLHTQHAHLVSIQSANKMPLEYVSYLVQTGRLEQAIGILEQGRALLWSEMRGLRTSINQLNGAYPVLASRLSAINQDLETLTTSIPPVENGDTEVGAAQRDGGMDEFGQLLKKQRVLLDERDTLISQIQRLPNFESFLKAASFNTLRAAASRGPVIIVNHCEYRSDILIVLHRSPPSLITTADDFYNKANELANLLLDTRKKYLLESLQYQRALRSALKKLYELVGKPIINRLHHLNIPEQSRVWWCPTSVFCSLPLHAMGPISSNDKVKRYFSDAYISSYTPTLSALIKSREPGVHSSEPPSLQIIAPPEMTLPGVREEIEVIKRVLNSSVDNTILEDATSETAKECLRQHRFAHFACHGVLETGKPFDAAFQLRGDNRLTLLDIVRSRLPTAEFALLSACNTAELTDGSIADEALHLTAAMQYCGFRSVVGTMWAMADTDGRDLAEQFYKSMFLGEDRSAPHYERSARALRDAVQMLRRERRLSLERWVNFVHYGA